MQQWEYKQLSLCHDSTYFERLGKDGWEPYAAVPNHIAPYSISTFYFKRPKQSKKEGE